MRKRSKLLPGQKRLALCVALALIAGCRGHEKTSAGASVPESQPEAVAVRTTAPATRAATIDWENAAKHVRLSFPSTWKRVKNPDYELTLLPNGASNDDRRITLDVPDLPPHLPWMIQMNRIEHDYLQDLKKLHPDLKLVDAADTKVPNAAARLVRSKWQQDKVQHEDVVLLMIHANAVYILDARSDDPHLSETRRAFDSIEASLRWR